MLGFAMWLDLANEMLLIVVMELGEVVNELAWFGLASFASAIIRIEVHVTWLLVPE